jgi:hypothetical protein
MSSPNFKTINYRGGIVRFRIPAEWLEEYGKAGGGTFYLPGNNTGTLRLNVMTFGAPPGRLVTVDSTGDFLAADSAKYACQTIRIRDGVAMIRYDLPANEGDHSLRIRYWRIAQALPPKNVRLVLFSYTLLAKQFDQPTFIEELEVLHREIIAAEFASILGE